MKVRIECDKRLKEHGGTEYEGGWFHYTIKGDQQEPDWKSADRWPTYGDAKRAVAERGHELDNAGWKFRLLMWHFHSHSFDGFPGWEHEKIVHGQSVPAFVKLMHKRGKSGTDVESHALASAWDDVAEVDFYQRDWTGSGIPFVEGGEAYYSGWWFATIAERDRFVQWAKARGVEHCA